MHELLLLALKNGKIRDYFRGSDGYRLFSYNGDPSNALIQDHGGVVWSFHTLHKERPDLDLPSVFSDALDLLLDSPDICDLYTSVCVLSAQVFAESNRFSSFKTDDMDRKKSKLRDALLKHRAEAEQTVFKGELLSIWDLAKRNGLIQQSAEQHSTFRQITGERSDMNMDALKNYATKLLECALELVANKYTSSEVDELDRDLDELDLYMISLGPYEICVKDAQGNDVICHSIKMQAIYDYHRDHQDLCVDKKVFDSLFYLTRIAKSPDGIYELLEVIEHQIVAECQGRAPFKLDITTLLDNLGKNLEENKALYESDIYEQEGFMAEIRRRSRLLSENHGYTLLCDNEDDQEVTAERSFSQERATSSGVKDNSALKEITNETTDPQEQMVTDPSTPANRPALPTKDVLIGSEEQPQPPNAPYDEILYMTAEEKTKTALDFYFFKDNPMALFSLLLGMGHYEVEAFPGAGHRHEIVLLEIYKYSRKHPDRNVLGAFETVFKLAAGKIVNNSILESLIEYLYFQLHYEEDGTAPFAVNIRDLITSLKNGLDHPLFKGHRITLSSYLQHFERYLYQRFGIC